VELAWKWKAHVMDRPLVSVAMFAYNEEALITRALDAILACRDEADLVVNVLINGCTDRTEEIVRARAAADPTIRPIVIVRGDKANAWSHYVHEVAPKEAAIHVFTDGDMEISKGSIAAFLARFAEKPEANGCAGMPDSGRQKAYLHDCIRNHGEMYGNLYALRGSFVMRVRAMGVRLPFGLFDELSPLRLEHWRIYRNRRQHHPLLPRRQRLEMLFDWEARRRIARDITAGDAAKAEERAHLYS
jgi:glycosyltransferase involved in cell wall biosynthesis